MMFFMLLLVFVMEYTRPDQFLPFLLDLRIYSILPVGLFLLALSAKTRNENTEIFRSSIARILMWFFAIVTFSTLVASFVSPHVMDRAWGFLTTVLGYLFLFFMVSKLCDDKGKLKWLFRVIVGIHVWLIFQNPALLTEPNQRSYIQNVTFLGDGNDFSLSVAIALPMCLYLFQSAGGSMSKLLYLLAGAVMIGAIMGTQSRGATLAVIAVIFYLWTLSRAKGRATVLIVAGLIVVLSIASEAYISRVQSVTNYQADNSAQGRLTAWKASIGMANRRPVSGVGPGLFPILFDDWYARPGRGRLNAHSVYFQALGELGYPGAILLILLIWVMFRSNQVLIKSTAGDSAPDQVDMRRLMIAVTGSVIAFSVAGAFLSVLYYPHLFVVAGIVFASHRIYARHQREQRTAGSGADLAAALHRSRTPLENTRQNKISPAKADRDPAATGRK